MSLSAIAAQIADGLIGAGIEAAKTASTAGVSNVSIFGHLFSVASISKELQTLSSVGVEKMIAEAKSGDPAQELQLAATVLGVASIFASQLAVPAAAAEGAAIVVGGAEKAFPILGAIMGAMFKNIGLVPVAGGAGGYVSPEWASDPREQVNPDGSFKQKGFLP